MPPDFTPAEVTSPSPGATSPLRRLAPLVVLVLVAAGGVILVARNGEGLRTAVSHVGFWAIVVSAILAIAGTACVEQIWVRLLIGAGETLDARAAASVFFISQFGKYLPGSLWPVLAQMEFGRRSGIRRRVMLSSNICMLAIVAVTGLLVGAALLPWSQPEGLRRYAWAFLFLPPLLAALHPRTIPWVLDLILRALHREPLGLRVKSVEIARACGWGFATWALLGAHVAVMTAALGGDGLMGVVASVGGMALGFAAGLLFPLTPAGAGIRDAVIVLTLTPQIGATNALAVALASRVLMVLADALLAGAGGLIGRRAIGGMSARL
ncbi:MAG: lysylphosphatidylglycerol synthase domain-containing protein [Lapillicoccus sp.]